MWAYESTVKWTGGKEGTLSVAENPGITAATPPEFGGPADRWSPEQLLTSAVVSCLMTTALHYFERVGLELLSYDGTGTSTLEKTRSGLAFTTMAVDIHVVVAGGVDEKTKAEEIVRKAEAACPVSNALECEKTVNMFVECQEK